jgi:D-alanyl-D-alanine carboxypeptidase
LKKKAITTLSLSVIAITIISGVVFTKISTADDNKPVNPSQVSTVSPGSIDLGASGNDNGDFTYIPPTLEDGNNTSSLALDVNDFEEETADFVPNTEMDLDPASITVFVNKEYSIPKNYKPTDLVTPNVIFNLITYDERTLMRKEAADALEKLFAAAKKDDVILYGISGYRSYQRQYHIFTSNIVKKGKVHTLKYSAVPGTSEHQTGLAIDVSSKSLAFKLSSGFSSSPEGLWLAENAHRYGYIIRYPEDKADITGYAYEPWHIRYVGIGLANYLYINQLTLDEYYNYAPSPGFDFEKLYANIINYVPPIVTVTPPLEGDGVMIGENGEIIEGELEEGDTPTNDIEDVIGEENPDVPTTEDPVDDSDLPPEDADETEDPISEEIPDEQGQATDDDGDITTNDPADDTTDPTTETPANDTPSNAEGASGINVNNPVVNNGSDITVTPTGFITSDDIIN